MTPQLFSSEVSIGDHVSFLSDFYSGRANTIPDYEGTVIAVRFTKSGIFYDIVDDTEGQMHRNVSVGKLVFPSSFIAGPVVTPVLEG